MTSARYFFTCLTCIAMKIVSVCNAGILPPPTNLSHKWLDPFTVTIFWSWERPSNLPKDCEIKFEIYRVDKELNEVENHLVDKKPKENVRHTEHTHFTNSCLTEETGSDHWNYSIRTISNSRCDGWKDSHSVITTVQTAKPRAEVVKDFKCNLDNNGMNCSWIPVNQSLNLTLSYRRCGESEEVRNMIKECDRYYRHGMRDGCYLNVGNDNTQTCINAYTEAALSTFKPLLVVPSPKLTIKQEDIYIYLNWTLPKVGVNCGWKYNVCYIRCNEEEVCKETAVKTGQMREPYDENCLYEFRSRVSTDSYCPQVSSDFSEIKTYGANKPPDGTLTVVAIVIPIILSLCVILSCYCFRRHRAIICPIIPDPSAIFKEMMMNGNKEVKPTGGRVYTPVPEPTEDLKITIVKHNSVPQQNS